MFGVSVASVLALLATGCAGNSTDDAASNNADRGANKRSPSSRLTAAERNTIEDAFQNLQWSQSGFASVLMTCALLAEAGEASAKRCFAEGGEFSGADEEWRAATELVLRVTGAAARDTRLPCRQESSRLLKGLVEYAETITNAQLAGADGDEGRFARAAGRVVTLTPFTGELLDTFQRECLRRDAAPLDTKATMPEQRFRLLRMDSWFAVLDAKAKAPLEPGFGYVEWRATAQCMERSRSAEELVACAARSEAGPAARADAAWQKYTRCLSHMGEDGAERCEMPKSVSRYAE